MTNTKPESMSLQTAWKTLIVPTMDEITDRTADEYRQSLAIWTRLSGDPSVGLISREIVKTFRDKLTTTPFKRGKQSKRRSPATVNRIMRDLRRIISPLWPADRVNPGGLGLTPFFKFPKQLERQRKLPFVFETGHLDKLYLNCDACKQTPGCRIGGMNRAATWRTALTLGLNCGARTWDLFSLRWDDVRTDAHGPFQFGSVLFGARKTNKLHRIPLNQCSQRHLIELAKTPSTDGRIFAGFNKTAAFYGTWGRITAAAGVAGTFESLRKTCVTRHNSLIWNSGFWLSGHIQPGVFGYYDNPNDRIFEAVYKLEQPAEFIRGMEALGV
jgi:integrase